MNKFLRMFFNIAAVLFYFQMLACTPSSSKIYNTKSNFTEEYKTLFNYQTKTIYTHSPFDITSIDTTPQPSMTPTVTATPQPSMTFTQRMTVTPDFCDGSTWIDARYKFKLEEIVSCLKTPEDVVKFMSRNIKWTDIYDKEGNNYPPAHLVYERGGDDCDGLAILAAYILRKNGFDAWNMGINIFTPYGHNVTLYIDPNDGKFYTIDNGRKIYGPFNDIEEAAKFHIKLGEVTGVSRGDKFKIYLYNPMHTQIVYPETYKPDKILQSIY